MTKCAEKSIRDTSLSLPAGGACVKKSPEGVGGKGRFIVWRSLGPFILPLLLQGSGRNTSKPGAMFVIWTYFFGLARVQRQVAVELVPLVQNYPDFFPDLGECRPILRVLLPTPRHQFIAKSSYYLFRSSLTSLLDSIPS